MGKPTGFMEINRQPSTELPPEERIQNFNSVAEMKVICAMFLFYFSLPPLYFSPLFLFQLFTAGQWFPGRSVVVFPAGCAVSMSGTVYTLA